MRGAVRIVFDRLNRGDYAMLVALEIDEAVALLVAAADVTRRETAAIVRTGELPLVSSSKPFSSVNRREGVRGRKVLSAIRVSD